MAESLGLDELRAHALNTLALATSDRGLGDGYAEMRESIAIAVARNSIESYYGYNNLSVMFESDGRMDEAYAAYKESERLAQRFGAAANLRWAQFTETYWLYARGDWEGSLRETERLLTDPDLPPTHYHMNGARARRALILLARGDAERAREDVLAALDVARASADPQQVIPTLGAAAYVLLEIGDTVGARRLIEELLALPPEQFYAMTGSLAVSQLVAVTRLGVGAEYIGRFPKHHETEWSKAAARFVAGEPTEAADIYERMGLQPDEALARLVAAQDFVGRGRRADADAQLRRALVFFRSVGARRYVRQAEELLAATA
jgi:tetratricopeptide (TPR) repeat protein